MKLDKIILQSSPHLRDRESVHSVMHTVIIALLPPVIASVIFFGFDALRVILVATFASLAFEALCLAIRKQPLSTYLTDGSAAVTGILLALNLPSNLPTWMVVVGAAAAIILGKQVYGGIGNNPFNPALVGRVFLLISFPTAMTTWPVTRFQPGFADGMTAATPLGILKTDGLQKLLATGITHWDLFVGNVGGSLGEVSALAILIGAAILFWRKIITWHIPVSFIGTVFVLTGIAYLLDPAHNADPLFHILAGGVFLGAFFMATDMVTSPVTKKGMILFGIGCGLLTCIIRFWAGYPEGVSFSILVMNALVPLIDKWFKPKVFGEK